MSKENNNRSSEKPGNNSEVEYILDIGAETASNRKDRSRSDKNNEAFQKEFKAVFDEETGKKKRRFAVMHPEGFAAGLFDWIRCMIFAVAIVVFCLTFVFRLVEVDGTSMNNTLAHRDKVIVTNLFYQPHNNDVVVISHGSKYDKPIIKRVIAIGGQNVKLDFDNEKIFVDGIELSEPYLKDKGKTFAGNQGDKYLPLNDDGSFTVLAGKVFVMGDNRFVSLDSRSEKIGLIDVNNIIGKAQIVVFPFNHFGFVYDK